MKKVKTEEAAAEKTMRKKVMKRVSPEHVEFVLSSKPTPPRILTQEESDGRMSDELRHVYALYDEIISNKNELLRNLQHEFRNDLDTKGFVEVEIEVTDDKS